ncbi:Ig-like domain-containing protein [Flavobacterium sinopsychrotolerans]|uniref:Gliding motility-associated C-terminal domain-containing protein n=1 Tax=Flavobacterium sinopsychrotolerans TaxID=604089 RepID=A0A1H8KY62_9FLAO|nr:Ig-like domain-containing protein [Flavobacterium sinopsychrotolerans]SEN97781.1 gliding motility-associated C-terminal domain-containing protein [Flavobacterium sinopsychrotolerans]
MKHFYPIIFLFFLLFFFTSNVQSQTINLVRFNNTANYTSGSGVSVLINPTGIFNLDNKFILELSDVGGNWASPTMLTTLDEFYVPVVNGTLPATLAAGSYKLRIRSTNPVVTIETGTFNVVSGSGIGIPTLTSALTNNSNFFNCIKCTETQTIFGSLNRSDVATVGAASGGISASNRNIELCDFDTNFSYSIKLVGILDGTSSNVIHTSGVFSIPSNLGIGTYVFEIEKSNSTTSSIFSVIFLFHGNATNLGNSTSETVCVDEEVTFNIETSLSGIGRNYLGSKYTINFGDGSDPLELTHAQLMSHPILTHKFQTVSCDKTNGAFTVEKKLWNKGISTSCNTFVLNGGGVSKSVNASKSPQANFDLKINQCITDPIKAINTTVKGSYGVAGCLKEVLYSWYFKKPGESNYTSIPSNSPWINSINDLTIPSSFITISGCWDIKLEAVNPDLCQSVTEAIKTIKIETVLDPTFTNTPSSPICPNVAIQFTDTTVIPSSGCQDLTYSWIIKKNGVIVTSSEVQAVAPSTLNSPSPLIKFIQPGIYTVTLDITNSCGTKSSAPKEIVVNGAPTVSFSPGSLSVCDFNSIYTLDFTQSPRKPVYSVAPFTPNSYLWIISGAGVTAADYTFTGGTSATDAYPKIIFNAFKTYIIEVKVDGNCIGSNIATFTFALKELPNLIINNPTAVCSPSTVDITVPAITSGSESGLDFTYWTDASATIALSTPSAITASGTYYIKGTKTNGCPVIKPVTVTVNALPTIGGTLYACIGATSQLSGSVTPTSGNPWICSDTSIATISSTGLVTAIAIGSTSITYTNSNGCSKSVTFTVNALPSITGTLSACINATSQLTGSVTAASISPWLSSNTTIATVSNTGLVTAKSAGTTIITHKNSNNCTVTSTFTVNALPTLTGTLSVCVNSTSQLTGSGTAASSLPWVSSNIAVATVNATGLVTAVSAGTSDITYTNLDGCTVNVTFTVNDFPTITGLPKGCVGSTLQLTGSGTVATSSPWVSSNLSVATVSATGLVTSIAVGTTTITYKNSNNCTVDLLFTVNELPNLIITNPLVVCSPDTVDISSTAITTGSDSGLDFTYWTNLSATTVLSTPSAITASGTYYIKGTNSNGCSIIKSVSVTINPQPTIGGTLSACIGLTSQLTGSANAATTTPWVSSNLSVATVSDTGLVTAVSAGTCDITYENSNGCIQTVIFTVNVNPIIITSQTQTICTNTSFSIAPLDGSGNIVPIGTSYSWGVPTVTGGITGGIALVNQTTISGTLINGTDAVQTATYTVTPKSGNCSGNQFTVVITVNPSPKVQFSEADQVLCSGSDTLPITLSSPTTGNVTFNWTATVPTGITGITSLTGTNTIPVQNLSNTTTNPLIVIFSSTATLENNGVSCSGTIYKYEITINPPAQVNQPLDKVICNNQAASVIFASANTGGTTTYSWTNSDNSINLPATGTGDISFTASNSTVIPIVATIVVTPTFTNGGKSCSGTPKTFTITVNPTLTVDLPDNQEVCNGFSTNAIVFTRAIPNTVYNWTNTNATIGIGASGVGNIPVFTAINNGINSITTSITVTPSLNGCFGLPKTFTITVNPSPAVTFSQPNQVICSGSSNTSVNLTSTTAGTAFSWTAIQPTGITGVVTSGTSSIPVQIVTNTTNEPIVVTYLAKAELNTGVSCEGATYSYTITVNPVPLINSQTATICSANAFNVIPQNGGGTIVPANTLYSWSSPIVSPIGAITGGSAQGVNQNSISQTLINVTDQLATATYMVTPKSGTCTGTPFTVVITVNPSAKVAFSEENQAICTGTNTLPVVLTSATTGNVTFNWIANVPAGITGVTSLTGTNTIPVQNLINTTTSPLIVTYTSTATLDNNGVSCKGALFIYSIMVYAPIVITTNEEKDITCFGDADGKIAVTVTGGTTNYNYIWTKDNSPFATTEDISNLIPGVYTVTVSDTNNCGPETATFTITQPPVLALNWVGQTDVLCYGVATGAITVSTVGGTPIEITPGNFDYKYAWTGPNGFTSTNQNLRNLLAGAYDLTVTDNSGCFKKLSTTITQPDEIIITATTTPIICYGGNDASIKILISGGIAPYTINWSNLGGGDLQDNLSAGDYLVTVTDDNDCIKTLNVNIPEAPIFTVNPVVKNISCFGMNDGSINLNIIGGIVPVKLVWDDSAVAGNVRNNLRPGTYTVTISDGKPCTISRTFIILEPQKLVISANVTDAFDCDDANSGAINLLVAGGTTPFTYSWSNGVVTEDLSNIPAGNYSIIVTDARGCSEQAQYSINRQPPIVIGIETKTDFNCETKYVKQTFLAQVSGGFPPYQLVWSSGTVSGANNEIMNTTQNGTTILDVTDNLGCTSSYSFNVKNPVLGNPDFTTNSIGFSTYGIYSIIDPIQFTNTATGDFINIAWDFGDGSVSNEVNPIHSFVKEGIYIVNQTVTYPFGCIYTHIITLAVDKGYELMSPNGFTPNGDGINETFKPAFLGMKSIQLDVYDTWGELVYSETGETLQGWDGKVKGKESENGNYYYKVKATTFYGTVVSKDGPFTLIK